jgi:chromate transporter
VGVVLNLGVWFALHTLFASVEERHVGALRVFVPDLATTDLAALGLAVAAGIALLRFHRGMLETLAAAALAGALLHVIL